MGVEPTKDRLAAPPGFEVRTPHRGRFSSLIRTSRESNIRGCAEQIEPVLVHAAQVATAQSDAMTIEELEDLDRDLAAVIDLIAELRSRELALFSGRGQARGDLHHFRDRIPEEEMVVRDLVDLSHPRQQLRQAPDFRFRYIEQSLDVAHARR